MFIHKMLLIQKKSAGTVTDTDTDTDNLLIMNWQYHRHEILVMWYKEKHIKKRKHTNEVSLYYSLKGNGL